MAWEWAFLQVVDPQKGQGGRPRASQPFQKPQEPLEERSFRGIFLVNPCQTLDVVKRAVRPRLKFFSSLGQVIPHGVPWGSFQRRVRRKVRQNRDQCNPGSLIPKLCRRRFPSSRKHQLKQPHKPKDVPEASEHIANLRPLLITLPGIPQSNPLPTELPEFSNNFP